jgi:hypothetical protein
LDAELFPTIPTTPDPDEWQEVLWGATEEDITIIHSLLLDETLTTFGRYIGKKVLWNSNNFVNKFCFASRGDAFQSAFAQDLI